MEKLPSEMNLVELQDSCWREIAKFSRKEQSEDQYCLEIFRRALVLADDQAWEILHQRFKATIVGWLRQHPSYSAACRVQSEEDYVTLTIERLWKVTQRNQEMEFRNLGGALRFLRLSLNSAIIDTLRERKSTEVQMSEASFEEPAAPDEEESRDLWDAIQCMISDPRERRLAYLLFYCNLKPREIVQHFPDEFPDVQEIFQMKRKILDRLMRYINRLRWLLGHDEEI